MKNYFLLPFIAATLFSCTKKDATPAPPAPVIDFSFSGNNNPAPTLVTITNNTKNATSYYWNFGDGTSISTDINPKHVYLKGGTYTIKLNAFNPTANGSSEATATKSITIANEYTNVNINSITLFALPTLTSFTGYIRITDALNSNLWTSSNITINPSNFPSVLLLTTPFVCTDLNKTYIIEVWKVGNLISSDIRVGVSGITPNVYIDNSGINAYPTTLTLPTISGTSMKTVVRWY